MNEVEEFDLNMDNIDFEAMLASMNESQNEVDWEQIAASTHYGAVGTVVPRTTNRRPEYNGTSKRAQMQEAWSNGLRVFFSFDLGETFTEIFDESEISDNDLALNRAQNGHLLVIEKEPRSSFVAGMVYDGYFLAKNWHGKYVGDVGSCKRQSYYKAKKAVKDVENGAFADVSCGLVYNETTKKIGYPARINQVFDKNGRCVPFQNGK